MKKFVIASLLMTSAAPALAQGNFYGEFLLGNADQTVSGSGGGVSVDVVSDSDIAFGLRGGYQFNETFSAELTLQELGEVEDNVDGLNLGIDTSIVALGIKAALPINDQWALSGRVGFASWDSDLSVDGQSDGSEDGSDLYYGVGVDYSFNDTIYLGVEYTLTDMDFGSEEGVSIENEGKVFSLSLGYKF